jgi:DNA-binding transcriptional MerR regulator
MTQDLIAAIRGLSHSPTVKKSKVGQIRELLTEIEYAQRAGVRLADIAAALDDFGFEEMNVKCLQNLLYQARRKKIPSALIPPTMMTSTQTIQPEAKSPTLGIDAESILLEARNSMRSKSASSDLTLSLLRSQPPKSTNERK